MHANLSRRALLSGAAGLGLSACAGAPEPALESAPRDVLGALDGVGVAALIRTRAISAREAVEAAIARAERMEPRINAIASPAFDRARAAAASPVAGPFAGVPTLVKNLTAWDGEKLMYGSRAFATNVARGNDPYVQTMLAAGLNPIGSSTTPEFGYTATTEPILTGATRNPWNVDHSSGGSSGGAAAAVAAGIVPVAHASDGGGSIRIPASCCGLVGLKPSRGRASAAGDASAPVSISVHGVVSRSVRDTAAWFAATESTGADAPLQPVGLVTGPSQRRLRVGLAIDDMQGGVPDPEVAAAITAVAQTCEGLGHRVVALAPFLDGDAFADAFTLYWAAGAGQTVRQVGANAPGVPIETLLEPLTLQLAAHFAAQPEGALQRAIGVLRASEGAYGVAMQRLDVILTPVLARPAPRIGELSPTLPFDEGFARVMAYATYTPLQNACGAPAISLPLGMSATGLPIGAQFSAAIGDERTLLELAYELELAMPWAARKPPAWAG